MILIKDRHWTVRINSRAFAHSGNMILIKDRHHFKFHMFSPLIFTGEKYDTYKGSTRAEWKIWR